ncbi:hypothetical protein BV25DRAFT_1882021 [Artomyces pyxidatus]|uniref:Uncharacterized protein n=1 Tax=Artomyces pyxidatus TaxID=48021 RepID=A0ACB8T812_9AGAM|nr:hypothetical protein BV25DRAFT_1882021 [Artomyces pyxidatus]
MAINEAGRKKRRPPTFQHLPIDRAKKLKRDWVEKQKIKSKWKAEKRKEGIVSQRDVAALTRKEKEKSRSPESGREDTEQATDEEDEPEIPLLQKPRKATALAHDPVVEGSKPSLRELQKQAYSRASLHNFKSDPLHRSRGRGKSDRGRGVATVAGGNRTRGSGGQPDMKLRMSAMLEKIKRDYA